MSVYYNEIDSYAASWLRNLMSKNLIADGCIDERSIEDVHPSELREFKQCHFFAGIGVWSYALRSSGWPDDRPVWTGSCPCQPFSTAGKGAAFDDERHLWPAFHHLIKECAPAKIIGEQVASKDADPWIDLVQTDLEALGYAFGAIPFPSAGVGAPHIRDRLYWVADTTSQRLERSKFGGNLRQRNKRATAERGGEIGGMAHDNGNRRQQRGASTKTVGHWNSAYSNGIDGNRMPTNGFWRNADWLLCTDGKWRPVESGTFPLAHGSPARVGRLRSYGNALNAKAAQAFIECVMESA